MSTKSGPWPALAALAAALSLSCGLGSLSELKGDETPEIPTDLLYGRDSLVLRPIEAADDAEISQGNLERFETIIRLRLNELVLRQMVPPVFGEDDVFHGDTADVCVQVTDVVRRSRQRFRWFGAWVTTVELSVEIQFRDHQTGEPLGDWVDLSAIHGPAAGRSLRSAMEVSADQITAHIRRDRMGQ